MNAILPLRWASALILVIGLDIPAARADSQGVEFFEKKIRPVLVEHCYQCHSSQAQQAKKLRGDLLLDSTPGMQKGGEKGALFVPGKPAESLLINALKHQDLRMPPKVKLPAVVIADFETWITRGAPLPSATTITKSTIDWNKARKFWSFQPPTRHPQPAVKNGSWARSAIDSHVLAAIEQRGLEPMRPATKQELLRRATFDLIGLPPTPEEVQAFLADESPDAITRVIDRLLASPQYGERWGRHWLDVARYAEDQAHTFAAKSYTNAYRYRDWVINAFNDDMPYDRFVSYQIAADLMLSEDAERVKHLPALGYFGLGAQYYKDNTEILKALADELDERVDTLGRGFLGLTVACARCHDHKFDPVPTQDYYSLAGIFNSTKLTDLPLASTDAIRKYQDGVRLAREADEKVKKFLREEKATLHRQQAATIERYLLAAWKMQQTKTATPGLDTAMVDRWKKYVAGNPKLPGLDGWRQAKTEDDAKTAASAVQQQVVKLFEDRAAGKLDKNGSALLDSLYGDKGQFALSDDQAKNRLPVEKKQQLEQMQQELAQLKKDAPDKMETKFGVAHGLAEGNAADMKVYQRGNPRTQGDAVPRRFLRVLTGDDPPPFNQGSGRKQLADAIATKDNPLTARVIVNRVWHWHFGRGLVGTPSNFGELGERPTHPELLDDLTVRFIESGWSLKWLHREIMLSATYQSSSDEHLKNQNIDGDNKYLWRVNRRRLDVESWRDALLAVSGKLDATMGGPTLELASTSNLRRTVYGKISRHELNSLLRLFDFPDANITSEKRTETTVPQQQLFVLNSAFVADRARALAARIQTEAKDDVERVQRAYLLAFSRPASDADVQLALRYINAEDDSQEKAKAKLSRWERWCQVLLASNEFMYVD